MKQERKKINWLSVWAWVVWPAAVWACIAFLLAVLLTSCQTINDHESYAERHRIESMMQWMDSVMTDRQTSVQDSSWRETVIRELQSIKERHDTSRVTVVDTAGNVVREKIVITNTTEVSNEKHERELEGMRHSIECMDSTVARQSQQLSRMDSLLQQRDHERTVVEQEPWYSRLWQKVKFVLIGIVIGILIVLGRNIWNDFRRIAKWGIGKIYSRF